jgi:glycine/D-amino acid oxidase-like deaminating enzyme
MTTSQADEERRVADEEPDVAVVGAGAVGVTAAYDLARRGASVTVFDRGPVAAGATGRAAGICYDAFAEDVDARIAARAMERFRSLDGTGPFAFRERPYVFLARTGDERRATAIERSVERMRVNGRDVDLLDPEEVGSRFPVQSADVAVAAVAHDAAVTDPAAYAEAMATLAREAGVAVHTETPVGVRTDPPGIARVGANENGDGGENGGAERFDAVVVAAGAHTKRLLDGAGLSISLKPYRVQAFVGGAAYDGPTVYDATAGVYLRSHPDGLLAGDGTEPVAADPDDWDRSADDWFRAEAGTAVRERTGLDPDIREAWAGLCTATPDGNPLLGELVPGVFVAAGWHGHGFMRAPATGEAIADQVLGGDGVGPFDPSRFDGDEQFEVVEGMVLDDRGRSDRR